MTRAYFDSLGSDWDRLREGYFPEAVRERALESAFVDPGRLAVDVGAGTGFLTSGLAARGLRVLAVDQSPIMLEALRRKFPGNAPIECRVGSAERLPIADGLADYCFSNMLLHHVERPSVAIGEMARIVRPSGRVVVTDLDTHDHDFLRTEQHDRWMGFVREDIRQWFHEAGLASVRIESVREQCMAQSSDRDLATISIFLAIGTVPGSPAS